MFRWNVSIDFLSQERSQRCNACRVVNLPFVPQVGMSLIFPDDPLIDDDAMWHEIRCVAFDIGSNTFLVAIDDWEIGDCEDIQQRARDLIGPGWMVIPRG